MKSPISQVYHQTIENMIGTTWKEYEEAIEAAHRQMEKDGLQVHIIVLAHGDDPSRMASTESMLQLMHREVQSDRINIWLAYQGESLPPQLQNTAAHNGVGVIPTADEDESLDLPRTGKTENILRSLKFLHDKQDNSPDKQFVIFLDNDYLLYDAINVHLLYIPWVMDLYRSQGVSRDHLYTKAGGLRLKLSEVMQKGELLNGSRMPAKFIDLCRKSLSQAGKDPDSLDPAHELIPTYDVLTNVLGSSVVSDLESALDLTTRQGARSSRGLSCYLQARRDNPMARFLSEFSFLLHGDQGTSLTNWMRASLTPGYGLELSFLNSVIEHYGSGVVNIVGLPHAHHPKGETENFLLGIEMFALAMSLIDKHESTHSQFSYDDTWLYFSPTKLGLKRVAIKRPARSKFYPPLNKMLKESVSV